MNRQIWVCLVSFIVHAGFAGCLALGSSDPLLRPTYQNYYITEVRCAGWQVCLDWQNKMIRCTGVQVYIYLVNWYHSNFITKVGVQVYRYTYIL